MKYVAIAALTSLFVFGAPALTFAQYAIPQRVVGTGGQDATSTNFGIRGTLGQDAIGTTAGSAKIELVGYWYNPGTTVTAVDDPEAPPVPVTWQLHQNYPNPFNPTTTIQFDVPETARATLVVYDLEGRRVATLVNRIVERGIHRVSFDAGGLASGVYFYRIEAGRFQDIRKLVLLK